MIDVAKYYVVGLDGNVMTVMSGGYDDVCDADRVCVGYMERKRGRYVLGRPRVFSGLKIEEYVRDGVWELGFCKVL